MGYYLQMDGVDDRILLPSMTMTELEIDFTFKPKATGQQRFWSFPFGASYFMRNNTFDEFHASTHNDFKVNGVSVTNSTVFIPSNERVVARSILKSAMTQQTHIFNNNGSSAFVEGNIYRIKVFNGSTLMADYDLSTGDVQDKSGNGRHATLFGGTWVQDAITEPVPTPIELNCSTKQQLFTTATLMLKSNQNVFKTLKYDFLSNQSVYAFPKYTFYTKQLVTKQLQYGNNTEQLIIKLIKSDYSIKNVIRRNISNDYEIKNIIYSPLSNAFPTQQIITLISNLSLDFHTKQVISKIIDDTVTTKQAIFKSVLNINEIKQVIYSLVDDGYLTKQDVHKILQGETPIKLILSKKDSTNHPVRSIIFSNTQENFITLQRFYSDESNYQKIIKMTFMINDKIELTMFI